MSHVDVILQQLSPYLHEYGLFALFFILFLETFGLPLPGETLLIVTSLLAARGEFAVSHVLLVGWVAAVLGDNTAFYVGHLGGRALMLRLGSRIGVTPEKVGKMEQFYRRYGPEVVIVARFIVVARQFNGLVAGTSGMAPLRFLVYNVLGAGLWVGLWVTAAYYLGDHIGIVLSSIGWFGWVATSIAVAALAGYFGYRWWRHRSD